MKKYRIVIAKLGLDGHDRGAKFISRYLRNAGMEVIYTGIRQTPEAVCHIALQEDADLVGVSILSGAHNTLVPKLMEQLTANNLDTPVIVGGIIPDEDIDFLKSKGVRAVFTPGASVKDLVKQINDLLQEAKY